MCNGIYTNVRLGAQNQKEGNSIRKSNLFVSNLSRTKKGNMNFQNNKGVTKKYQNDPKCSIFLWL